MAQSEFFESFFEISSEYHTVGTTVQTDNSGWMKIQPPVILDPEIARWIAEDASIDEFKHMATSLPSGPSPGGTLLHFTIAESKVLYATEERQEIAKAAARELLKWADAAVAAGPFIPTE